MPTNGNGATRITRLDSWKEIGAFFGCTERTAKRWEQERGLPVHRIPGSKRGRVFAYPEELTRWMHERKEPLPIAEDEIAVAEAPDVEVPATETPAAQTAEVPLPVPPPPAATPQPHSRSRIPWSFVAIAALCVCVVSVLGLRLFSMHRAPAPVSAAEDLYLQGRYYWNKRTPENLTKAVDLFTQAIVRDPAYARPYVGLADCYNLLREFSAMPDREAYPRALAAAQKAVELDPRSAEAHTSLAFVSFYWKLDAPFADREFQRAIDLNPAYVPALHWHATFLMAIDRLPAALREIEHARQLDPASNAIQADKGLILFHLGRREEAVALLKQLESADPQFLSCHSYLRSAYLALGDYPGFLSESRQTATLAHDPQELALTTAAEQGFAAAGPRGLFDRLLIADQKLYADHSLTAYAMAQASARAGRVPDALRYLQISLDAREPAVASLLLDDAFTGLRGDPRFRDLLARFRTIIHLT